MNPLIMREFIDAAGAGGPREQLVQAAILFIIVALAHQLVSVSAAYVSEVVGWTATNALRTDLAEHCLHLDMSFHNAHTPGEMIERIDGDAMALTNFFSQFVIQVVGNALLMAGILVILYHIDWRVGLAISLFTVITIVVLARFGNIAVPHWKAERQASAELFGYLEERLAGTEDIRSSGAEAYVMRRFYVLMRTLMQRSLKAAMMVNILLNSSILMFTVGTAAAFAVGAWLHREGSITLGTVYIIFHYTTMLDRPIRQLTRQIEDFQKAGAGIARIQELFDRQTRITDGDSNVTLPSGALSVAFEDVAFGYGEGEAAIPDCEEPGARGLADPPGGEQPGAVKETVIQNVTFNLEPGTVLGLLGRTGSGKTTLTRLLLRLYDPDHGAIWIGQGMDTERWDIRQVPLARLRQRIGIVTQNIQLFHASVRDNLSFFDESIADVRIQEVLRGLGLEAWLDSLPDGLDTPLESGGAGLSAGEAQLLAFARIFLQDPGVVILDEASSRLDPATERLIERAVDRLVRDRTAIIIAHRLDTVQRAGEIMILDGGRISEHGPRAALAGDPASQFYQLLQTGLEEMLA
jgi:ABC-type multidrug transport system fused ATPase/permease subunit